MYRRYLEQLGTQLQEEQQIIQNKMTDFECPRLPLEELWKKLKDSDSKSLLKKHLTQERYEKLKDKKTKIGGTLADCIQSGEPLIILSWLPPRCIGISGGGYIY